MMEMVGTVGLHLHLQRTKAERLAFFGLLLTLVHHLLGMGVFAVAYFLFPAVGELVLAGPAQVVAYASITGPLQVFTGLYPAEYPGRIGGDGRSHLAVGCVAPVVGLGCLCRVLPDPFSGGSPAIFCERPVGRGLLPDGIPGVEAGWVNRKYLPATTGWFLRPAGNFLVKGPALRRSCSFGNWSVLYNFLRWRPSIFAP